MSYGNRGSTTLRGCAAVLCWIVSLAVAPAARANENWPGTDASSEGDTLRAGLTYVDVQVRGGGYPSRSGPVALPARLAPPCSYRRYASGARLAEIATGPYSPRRATEFGQGYVDWLPADAERNATADGFWYQWHCDYREPLGNDQLFSDVLTRWTQGRPDFTWVPAGRPVPEPAVPAEVLSVVAREAVERAVRMPAMGFSPRPRTVVGLTTWMWADPAAREPVSAVASYGGASVTVSATPAPAPIGLAGLPEGTEIRSSCRAGGRPYEPGSAGDTDCSITFRASSAGGPDRQWPFRTSFTWDVAAIGAPLVGPPRITRSEDEALTVAEVQTVVEPR